VHAAEQLVADNPALVTSLSLQQQRQQQQQPQRQRPERAVGVLVPRLNEEEMRVVMAAADSRSQVCHRCASRSEELPAVGVSKGENFAVFVDVYLGTWKYALACDFSEASLTFPAAWGVAVHNAVKDTWIAMPKYRILQTDALNSWGQPALLVEGPVTLGSRTFDAVFFATKGGGESAAAPMAVLGLGTSAGAPQRGGVGTSLLRYAGWDRAAVEPRADAPPTENGENLLRVHRVASTLRLMASRGSDGLNVEEDEVTASAPMGVEEEESFPAVHFDDFLAQWQAKMAHHLSGAPRLSG